MLDVTRPVLVTGATGALGPAVVRTLVETGVPVRVLARSEAQRGLLPDSVEWNRGDICDEGSVRAACAGTSAVVHLAGLLHMAAAPAGLTSEYLRINVEGTRTLADASVRAGVRRFVLASTIAVYGSGNTGDSSETTPPEPDTPYAATKLAAERIVLQQTETGNLDSVVLRLAATYGSRMKGNYLRLVRALSRGRFVMVGAGGNRRSLIHEDDVAAAVVAALRSDRRGVTYNIADGTPHTVREIVDAACAALGRPPPRLALPLPAARLTVELADYVGGLLGRRRLFSTALDKFIEDVVVDANLARQELAFVSKVTLASGWRASIAGMRAAGLLD